MNMENRRVCIHCSNETFPEVHEQYMLCEKCGAATYKAFQQKGINFKASKCPNVEDCYVVDQYRPECENLIFTPRCLVSLHTKLDLQDLKVKNHLKPQS